MDTKQPYKTIYDFVDNGYFEQYDVNYPKEFLLNLINSSMNIFVYQLSEVNIYIQQFGLDHGLLSHIVKVKLTPIA